MTKIPLVETISYILMEVCKVRRAISDNMLNEIGLHVGQETFFVALLAEEGLRQSELAERLHVQPATMTNMLHRLEQAGLVERHTDPDDLRVSRVYPTNKGRAMRDQLNQVWETIEKQTTQGMSLEERIIFRRLLLQAHHNLMQIK